MAPILFDSIISSSSFDPKFPDTNLLKYDGTAKWKCAKPGEKSVTAVLKLQHCSYINQVDIGNAFSALVEVLVGNEGMDEDSFQVLLTASSFMNPLESRVPENGHRVQIYQRHQLVKSATEAQWDRVKVVCTQPFNKHITYGLAFMQLHGSRFHPTFHTSPDSPLPNPLGVFRLVEPINPLDLSAGSLFARRKTDAVDEEGSRSSKRGMISAEGVCDRKVPKADANRTEMTSDVSTSVTVKSSEESALSTSEHSLGVRGKNALSKKISLSADKTRTSTDFSVSSLSSGVPADSSRLSSSSSAPLHHVLKGVIFAISGIQNPERQRIRDSARRMGALYCIDWTEKCTHLVCAFANTPKYKQAEGKSQIVKKEWIYECLKLGKRLPLTKFAFADAAFNNTSDDGGALNNSRKPSEDGKDKDEPSDSSSFGAYDHSTDEETSLTPLRVPAFHPVISEPVRAAEPSDSSSSGAYGLSTDEEASVTPLRVPAFHPGILERVMTGDPWSGIPALPGFLTGVYFFLFGEYNLSERKQLERIIVAYNGIVEDYMSANVTFVVTNMKWTEDFDRALVGNSNIIFVRPQWLFDCNDRRMLMPYQRYTVISSD